VRVHLAKAKVGQVKELLEDAWLAKAPPMVLERAVAGKSAARSRTTGEWRS
jgi:hypothetical protein